jgi:hypothetical protein
MVASPNPFNPNQPIDPNYFEGRMDEVHKAIGALLQTRNSKTQHLLIAGERGIGKTSLALYTRHVAMEPNQTLKTDFRFASAFYTVERGQNLTQVCEGLASRLLGSVETGVAQKCLEKLKTLKLHFGVHVPGVGQISVDPVDEKQSSTRLYGDFEKAVREFWDEIKESYNGILLILDETHNLDSPEGLGAFFKVVSESWTVDNYRNIMFVVVGLPKVAADISDDDPSAPRIFAYVELSPMTESESLAVIARCLSGTNKTIDEDAAKYIVRNSGGYPFFLQQLGYDAFNQDTDNRIDKSDAYLAVIQSLIHFDRMVFGRMYRSVEGKQKQKIVDALADHFDFPLSAKELEKQLRIKNIHQYLKPLEEQGIVQKVAARYRLSSRLLSTYVGIFKAAPAPPSPIATPLSKPTDPTS